MVAQTAKREDVVASLIVGRLCACLLDKSRLSVAYPCQTPRREWSCVAHRFEDGSAEAVGHLGSFGGISMSAL